MDKERLKEVRMPKFVIAPHMRLQEWVAEEKGYFSAQGLDYEFRDPDYAAEFAALNETAEG